MIATLLLATALAQVSTPSPSDLPVVIVNHDNVVVNSSALVVFVGDFIADGNGDGVVQVVGDNLIIDLGGQKMRGAPGSAAPETLVGTGIVVTGKNVTIRNGSISGFRCGVLARGCDGSTFEKLDLSNNYAMRLLSKTEAEDGEDWLWPHENDNREWVTRYGAGLCIERSSGVTVRDIKVRQTQNAIVLDRVTKSRIFDNDCSFLSGWGLAMWRSSENVVCRNAFDFCVRGYSHGVYNRGQDSAGLLMFEQCSKNTIAMNSITHGGDGIFGYAGHESLGDKAAPEGSPSDFHKRRGCNDNVFFGNDLSFAAAHGLEMTFSFGNVVEANRFEGNGICGIWAGYSCDTMIAFNAFGKNADAAIAIEHGANNVIAANQFRDEGRAINLWCDDNAAFATKPWGKANGFDSTKNAIIVNRFERCSTAATLRNTTNTAEDANEFIETTTKIDRDDKSAAPTGPIAAKVPEKRIADEFMKSLPGTKTPLGARASLDGREKIRMTAYGPWDGTTPLLTPMSAAPNRTAWKLLGAGSYRAAQVFGGGPLRVSPNKAGDEFTVYAAVPGWVSPYELRVDYAGGQSKARGCIVAAEWNVTFFPSVCDPRHDVETWRSGATSADSVSVIVPTLDFKFGNDGPKSLKPGDMATDILAASSLPVDHFGTIAKTKVHFPKGKFTIRVMSDDGVRVSVDGKTVIDDWTWHAPHESRCELSFAEETEVTIEVEHFELDGLAVLSLFVDGDPDMKREIRPSN